MEASRGSNLPAQSPTGPHPAEAIAARGQLIAWHLGN